MLRNSASIKALIKTLILLLYFVTPVIYTNATKEAYEFPKMYFVYFIGFTAVSLYLIQVTLKQERILKTLDLPILLILGANILASVTSTHIYTSLWGYYSRFNGGLMSVIVYTCIYILVNEMYSRDQKKTLIVLSVVGAIPLAIYTITQYITNYQIVESYRAYGSIGQPNWTAAYLGMLIPIAVFQLFKTTRVHAAMWAMVSTILYFASWVTFSISGMLGIFIGISALILTNKDFFARKIHMAILLSILLTPYFVFPGMFKAKIQDILRDMRKIQVVEAQTKIAENKITTENLVSDPGAIRLNLWKDAISVSLSSKKNFLFGIGPETFPYEFPSFRTGALNYTSEWDFIFNKPHNYYIEILVELGLIGFISYTFAYIYLLKKLASWARASFIVFLVTNFFGWPSVSTELMFILLASFAQESNELS